MNSQVTGARAQRKTAHKKTERLLRAVAVILVAFIQTADAQWSKCRQLFDNSIGPIVLRGSTIVTGSNGYGIFRSTDNGARWSTACTGLKNYYVNAFAVIDTMFFAGTAGGVYRSVDDGATWLKVNSGLTNTHVDDIKASGNHLFVGIDVLPGGVFLSTDYGEHWSKVDSGIPDGSVNAIGVNGNSIFAGTSYKGIFRSTDHGNTWFEVDSGLGDPTRLTVGALTESEGVMFASTSNGCFFSTNDGAKWTRVAGLESSTSYGFTVGEGTLFAERRSEVLRSTDNGNSWKAADSGLPYSMSYSLGVRSSTLFAGLLDSGIYRSTDNGTSWKAVNRGILEIDVESLLLDGDTLIAGTAGSGIYHTPGDGWWHYARLELTDANVVALSAHAGRRLAGTDKGVYCLFYDETYWKMISLGLTHASVRALATMGYFDFAGTKDNGVYRSTDYGQTWSECNSGLADSGIHCFAVNGGTLFAGTSSKGVFVSADSGANWTAANTGLPDAAILSLAIKDNNLFAGTLGKGVFLSTDKGAGWKPVNSGLENAEVRALAVNGNRIIAGTSAGVFFSVDNGAAWIEVDSGLTDTSVTSLAIRSKYLYAGTRGQGVWLIDLSDLTEVNDPGQQREARARRGLNIGSSGHRGEISVIEFVLPREDHVAIVIYDVSGRAVAYPVDGRFGAGVRRIPWNTGNVPDGYYVVSMACAGERLCRGISIVR